MKVMINLDSISSFLQVASDDEDHENRLAALEILTCLPLSADAWRAVASVAADMLRNLWAAPAFLESVVRISARIPVRSIRNLLAAIARDPGHSLSLVCATELARRGDTSGIERLLADATEDSMERLACLPLERLQTAREPFIRALSAENADRRLWAAIALARLGNVEPLEQAYHDLLHGADTPPLFWGNPGEAYNALAAARPLPPSLHGFLTSLYENLSAGPGARDVTLLIGGLTGIVDVDGELTPGFDTAAQKTDARSDPALAEEVLRRLSERVFGEYLQVNLEPGRHEALAALAPEAAGELMMRALDELEQRAQAEEVWPDEAVDIGNAAVELAWSLTEPIRMPLLDLVEHSSERWPHLPQHQLAWVLARAGAEALAAELGFAIVAAEGPLRKKRLFWGKDIAEQLSVPAPYEGAGPASYNALPQQEIIDDSLPHHIREPGASQVQSPPGAEQQEPEKERLEQHEKEHTEVAHLYDRLRMLRWLLEEAHVAPSALSSYELGAELQRLEAAVNPRLLNKLASGRFPKEVTVLPGVTEPEHHPVDCTVFAPDRVERKQQALLQVFLHAPKDRERAETTALKFDPGTKERGHRSLLLDAPIGTKFIFDVEVQGFVFSERVDSLLWTGEPQSVAFPFVVPAGCKLGQHVGVVRVWKDQTPIGRISFQIEVVASAQNAHQKPVGDDARRYRSCFCSYSSLDRVEMLKCAQGLQASGLKMFIDVLNLRPGDKWNPKIFAAIDECDLFVVIWSTNALNSKWVKKESGHALKRHKKQGSPDFRPIPVEGPPIPPVPRGLRAYHFNDELLLSLIRTAQAQGLTGP
jgi:hypothetical protein